MLPGTSVLTSQSGADVLPLITLAVAVPVNGFWPHTQHNASTRACSIKLKRGAFVCDKKKWTFPQRAVQMWDSLSQGGLGCRENYCAGSEG